MKKHCFLSKWILFESACLLQQPKITEKNTRETKKNCSTQSTPTHTSSFSQILFTRVQKKPTFEIYKKKEKYTKYIVLNGCCLMFYIFLLLL